MATEHETQRITLLTPLEDVLARVDALVKPVAPRQVEIAAALGRVLAEDVVAPLALPFAARALRDGYAVTADALSDAGPYAPTVFRTPPPRIDAGEILPPGTDAVALFDAIVARAGRFEAIAAVATGEGVLAPGADMAAGEHLRRAGERLRAADVAVLSSSRSNPLSVRVPQIRVFNARTDGDTIIAAACALIAAAIAAQGGEAQCEGGDLATAVEDEGCDTIIAIGGTGSGRNDMSVRTLARVGRVEVHGVALLPGETAALGVIGARPVLLVPGRVDAALAVWLTIGRHLMVRLCGCIDESLGMNVVLARKIASPLGFSEVVPLRCRDGKAEPIASGYWPLSAIAQTDGWLLVPADSEGYPAGAEVVLKPWP